MLKSNPYLFPWCFLTKLQGATAQGLKSCKQLQSLSLLTSDVESLGILSSTLCVSPSRSTAPLVVIDPYMRRNGGANISRSKNLQTYTPSPPCVWQHVVDAVNAVTSEGWTVAVEKKKIWKWTPKNTKRYTYRMSVAPVGGKGDPGAHSTLWEGREGYRCPRRTRWLRYTN